LIGPRPGLRAAPSRLRNSFSFIIGLHLDTLGRINESRVCHNGGTDF
jgi:hypothetical protein